MSLREAFTKALYWFGTAVLGTHFLEHLWPHALEGRVPDVLLPEVSNGCFVSARNFVPALPLRAQGG